MVKNKGGPKSNSIWTSYVGRREPSRPGVRPGGESFGGGDGNWNSHPLGENKDGGRKTNFKGEVGDNHFCPTILNER